MKTILAITAAVVFAFSGRAAAQSQENSAVQRPVTQQEVDRLKRQIDAETRSSVEAIVDYHTETGDLNNRLDFFRYGGRLNLNLGAASVFHVTGTRTDYLPVSSLFNEQGTNLTAGIRTRLTDSADVHVEAGATRFSTDTISVNALASVEYNPSDDLHLYVTASRENVEESLLSVAGIRPAVGPFAGQLVGRVMENRFVAGGSSGLGGNFDIFGEGGVGNRAGSNVPSNFFKTVGGGVGYSIVARSDGEPLSLLRAAYEVNYFAFDENRFGFGGASFLARNGLQMAATRIGSDGISPAGTGGYFSPQNFVSNIARIEARGGSSESLSYNVSAFLGAQNYTGASSRLARGLSAIATVGINQRVSLPVTYIIDNFGPFLQQSVFARLAVRF